MYPLYKSGNPRTTTWTINTLLFILFSVIFFDKSLAQTSDDSEKLDFTQNPDLKDSPSCLSYCLVTCIPIPGAPKQPSGVGCRESWDPSMGCTTTKCLCSDIERVEGALKRIHSCASLECSSSSYKDDSAAGQKLLLDYCSMKGYQFSPDGPTKLVGFTVSSTSTPTSSYSSTTISDNTSAVDTPKTTDSTPSQSESIANITTTGSGADGETDRPSVSESTSTSSTAAGSSQTESSDRDGSGQGKDKDFGTPEIVGTVIGALGVLAAVVGIFIQVKRRREISRSKV